MQDTCLIAEVAVQNASYHFDHLYGYLVPETFAGRLAVGCRVMVPFGKGSQLRQAVVIRLLPASEAAKESGFPLDRYKSIEAVLDKAPLIDGNMIRLAEYMRERTFCTLFDALRTMIPAGANLRTMAAFSVAEEHRNSSAFSGDAQRIVDYLSHRTGYVKKKIILSDLAMDLDSDLPDELAAEGVLLRDYDAVRSVGDATVRMVRLSDEITCEEDLADHPEGLTKKQRAAAEELFRVGTCSVKELCYFTGVTEAVLKGLLKKGVVEYYEQEIYRRPYDLSGGGHPQEIVLEDEQQAAFDGLVSEWKNGGGVSLLYGVTGSGKTSVYLRLIDEVRAAGKGVIVMVPEIALTPQTLDLFYQRYGDTVAIFHSGLSAGERLDEWKRVKEGLAKIVVGTRSAVFAPVQELGLVIMDEEQEHTYQSDMSPRYHARDIAKYRCAEQKALLVLASATPSFSTFAAAQAGKYRFHALRTRYGDAVLPDVITVDLCKERADGNRSSVSRPLQAELQKTLEEGHQAILLMNRRGYNTYAACESCGHVRTCPNCSISLTYHNANRRLMCHYCGWSVPFSRVCPECEKETVRYSGSGTQKVEEELAELLPDARILRMDADTTMQKHAYDRSLSAFRDGEYDIMVGTQMVAKGLDFENVTLVGVLNADKELYNDDYQSMERTFDLITQVVGRAGRGRYRGKAVIQTMDPGNEVIRFAKEQDYESFYSYEIGVRKAMVYPPFCTLVSVGFRGAKQDRTEAAAAAFLERLKTSLAEAENADIKLIALGPMPERVVRVGGTYRYRILLKCRFNARFREELSDLLKEFGRDRASGSITTVVRVENG